MIRLCDIKLGLKATSDDVCTRVASILGVSRDQIDAVHIRRRAIDARKKNDICYVYTVDVEVSKSVAVRMGGAHKIALSPNEEYVPVPSGSSILESRPVVVGSGPSGLFTALILASQGYRPIVLERGAPLEKRIKDVESFWQTGILNPASNAQFGEGGAGTFSDGKLATLINDSRCRKVLSEFVACGAPADILTSSKPHIGTDILRSVVLKLRQKIIGLGGEVRFHTTVTDIIISDRKLSGLIINDGLDRISCACAIFAIGHSARDTIPMLFEHGLTMSAKPFSIGVRIEHLQNDIDESRYGRSAGDLILGAADYKLSYHAPTGRSAYTFCMCPGGSVIAAASDAGHLVTNGMSLRARKERNANAALLVNVMPTDFPTDHALAGFAFQRAWESSAFNLGGSQFFAPCQKVGDFLMKKQTASFGTVIPSYQPGTTPSSLDTCLPAYVCDTIRSALPQFARQVAAFGDVNAVMTGVETRSSSPVRIFRTPDMQTSVAGVYSVGEGGGHAGGITSASVDGIKCAESIISTFKPFD